MTTVRIDLKAVSGQDVMVRNSTPTRIGMCYSYERGYVKQIDVRIDQKLTYQLRYMIELDRRDKSGNSLIIIVSESEFDLIEPKP